MVAEELDYVIGVDSHRDRHALALVAASGAPLLGCELGADEVGYGQALALVRAHAPARRAWALEGWGCYGKGLARFLIARGERVLEVERPKREGRRGRLKSDALDAQRAARLLLAERPLATPRQGGAREALRCLLLTRESAINARRVALNQLRALLITCPEPLRGELRGLTRARLSPAAVASGRAGTASPSSRARCWRCVCWRAGSRRSPTRSARSRGSSSPACRRWRRRCSKSRASVRSARPSS
jgi:transposase